MAENKKSEAAAAKAMPKSQVYKDLAAKTELEPKQVAALFTALEEMIKEQLGKGPGLFVIPNLVKFKLVHTPARPAGEKPDPFNKGQTMKVKAKEASVKVKPVILKGLKDLSK
jgi:nucleoid DNA-binding protein